MDLQLNSKRALVCGASRGLGYGVAQSLLREGAEVVITSRSTERLELARQSLEDQTGRSPQTVAADLTVERDREQLIHHGATLLGGPIELLLVNAGGPPPGPFMSHDAAHWQLAIDLALGSFTHLCRLVIPEMQKSGFGRIAQIVSIAGLEVVEGLVLSNASRPAVLGCAKALAREVAADGILVNSICPGIFHTARIDELAESRAAALGITKEDFLSELGSTIPLGRPGIPQELGDLAAFLLSPLNTYLTGAAIPIDGGKTLRLT